MKFILLVTCMGTITNTHITETKTSFYVEFKTGTTMACPMEIKIKDKKTNDLLGYWKGDLPASEFYKSNQDLTKEIPRIK